MSVTRRRIAHAALLGSASFLSLTFATGAQAQSCTVSSGDPLNNITTPSTTVTCTGVNNAGTVFVNTDETVIEVSGAGSTLSNGNVTLNGNSNGLAVGFGSTINNLFIITTGSNNAVEISGQATNIATAIGGSGDSLQIFATASFAARTGDIDLAVAAGQNQAVLVQGTLTASSGNGTDYLLTGGTGNQSFTITGTLTGLADGRLINGGDGDDLIFIGPNASISNGAFGPVYFEGGSGTDTITWRSGNSALTRSAQVSGVENAEFIAGAGVLSMGGAADYTNVNITSGVVRFFDLTAMGSNTANFTVSSGATAELDRTGANALGQNFAGGGVVRQLSGNYTYSGTGSSFSGAFELLAGANATLTNGNVFGTGTIANNGTISWGDFNLSNNISGTGQLIYNGVASTGDLSGSNTFSGGLDVRSGALRVMNVSALGTGTVTSSAGGAILQIDNAANQMLANNLTGALVLVKTNTGTLDLTGTNTFTGGTLIDNGAVRVDDLARLGTGQVITNANGSLILNYSGAAQLLQTTPFMTGSGRFIKEGTGDVVVDVANTYTGGTTIRAGRIGLNDGAALGTGNVQIDGGATLGVGNITLANDITGTGTVQKTAAGIGTLLGDNSAFTGLIDVVGGELYVNDGRSLGSGTVNIAGGNAVRILNTAGDSVIAASLTGAGEFIKSDANRVTLTGNNTLSGLILVDNGVLQVAGSQNLGTASVTLSSANSVLEVSGNGAATLTNAISGTGRLVKSGSGVLDVTGANTFGGGTTIQQGAIRVDDLARLGTGQVVANAGSSLILNYNGAGQLLQLTPFLTGGGSFIKEGSGDVVLDLASGYTGGTIIREGRLGLNNGSALGTGAIQIDAGAELGLGGVILSNNLTGSGLVRKTASNVVELYGNNTGFTGTLLVEDGVLFAISGDALGAGTLRIDGGTSVQLGAAADSVVTAVLAGSGTFEKLGGGAVTLTGTGSQFSGGIGVTGGTLQIAGSQNIGTASVFIGNNSTLRLDTLGSTTFGNVISGSGKVIKTGTGTVFMMGANNYTGGTDIQQGAIRVTDVSVLGTGAITVQAGAALDLSIAGAQTLAQNVTGAGILRKSGSGDLTLIANGLAGGVDITNGRVIFSTAGALGGGPVTTAAGTQLVFDSTTTETMSNLVSGAGGLTKNGSGVLVIQNANTYTGGTVINAGRLGLNNGQGLGTGGVLIQQGAQLNLGGVSVANNISGAGQVVKTASNIGTLTGTNTYSGGTDIQGGSLRVTSPAALGTGGVQMASGTALIVDYSGATNVALGNVLSGAGALVKDGSGTVVMNTAGNTYSGGTTINAGRLGLNFGDALGTGAVTIASGAELGIGGISYANATSGGGRIVKTSSGAAFLTGTNTHTGGLDIQGGSVGVTGSGALGSGAVSIASGASLDYTAASNVTFANGLSGAGTFNKLGTAQLTFGSNFSIGALNALAGRTRINAAVTTNATVASGATLDGTGRIIGNLVNNGTVAPGNSIGTLTVQGNFTHNAGSVLEVEFDASGNIDLLDVTGNAVLNGGTIRFVGVGGAEGQGGTFLRTGGSVTGTFSTIETVGAQLPLSVFYTANTGQMAPSVVTARPSTFNAQALAAADTAFAFIDTLGVADARHGRGNRLWLTGFGAWGNRSASGTTLAYDHETRGISGGVNVDLGGNFTLGGAVGWAKGDIELGSNGGGGDQTHTLGSLNLRYMAGDVTLGAGAVFGNVDQATLRNVSFNGFSDSVSGETDSSIVAFFAEAGVPLGATGGWNFTLNTRGSVVRQEQDAYTESGISPLRLRLGNIATESLEGVGRLTATKRLWDASRGAEENAAGLDVRVDLGGRYLALQGDRPIPVTFAVSNAGIVLQGDTRDTAQAIGGLALEYTTNGGAVVSFGYRGEIGKTDRHAVQAGVSIAF
jgi:autotransporter-associated beta strand protein